MDRVIVVGCPGSGRASFTRALARIMEVAVLTTDEAPEGEGRWVVDGLRGDGLDPGLAACDAVVVLDPPAVVCLSRALVRPLLRNAGGDGALEAVGQVWVFHWRERRRLMAHIETRAPHAVIARLRSRAAAGRWLARLAGVPLP
ncbi:hypothetical protein ABZ202_28970 [Streptomyces sp. NPDC006186]|uniref:hypothetical protein n=1 Tax=Streptomyces sp. NPDC006186 TaxID=3155248 RepID=UPI0033AC27D5